jgi:hypothetical protein
MVFKSIFKRKHGELTQRYEYVHLEKKKEPNAIKIIAHDSDK